MLGVHSFKMIVNSKHMIEKVIKVFEDEIREKTVSVVGVNVVSADDLISFLGFWKENLK